MIILYSVASHRSWEGLNLFFYKYFEGGYHHSPKRYRIKLATSPPKTIYCITFSGIVPFVATPRKGRYVVFLKWLLISYFRLGDCPTGLGYWPRRVRAPAGARNMRKATVNYDETPLKRSCHKRDYIPTYLAGQ